MNFLRVFAGCKIQRSWKLTIVGSPIKAEAAAKMAGHTCAVITFKYYLINEEERKMEKLRKVNNEFA